jgi:hypothetical protein
MATPDKKKTAVQIIDALTMSNSMNASKFHTILKQILKQDISDEEYSQITDLIHNRLGDARFDLYLKITPDIATRQAAKKGTGLTINRLVSDIRAEVKSALDELDPNLVSALDSLREKEQYIRDLLSQEKISNQGAVTINHITKYAIPCYIYTALKRDRGQTLVMENLLLSIIESYPGFSVEKHTGKLFPEILPSKNIVKKVEKFAFLHYKDHEKVHMLENELSMANERLNRLAVIHNEHVSEITDLKSKLDGMEKITTQKCSEISELQTKLKKAEDRLEYEVHKYKEEIRNFKIAYADRLKGHINVDLDGIKTTLGYVEEPEKKMIQRRISNIEDTLNNREG